MATLIYSAITSLDGYVADEDGNFDWAAPDEEVHTFVNDLERPVSTYLYGRRMCEVMVSWETAVRDRGSVCPAYFAGAGGTVDGHGHRADAEPRGLGRGGPVPSRLWRCLRVAHLFIRRGRVSPLADGWKNNPG